jgi:ubiquinone/menaquinone biosynthesis C-methylase UbiE
MHHSGAKTNRGILIGWSGLYDAALGHFIRRTDDALLALTDLRPGERLLDVGTGPGYLARKAAPRVGASGRAVGIDASWKMIQRAKTQAGRERSAAEFITASAELLPFVDASFDVVVSRLVIHHLPGELKERAVAEMRRVLAQGGRLVIADLTSAASSAPHHLLAHLHGNQIPDFASLAALVRSSGLCDVEEGSLGSGLSYVRGRR